MNSRGCPAWRWSPGRLDLAASFRDPDLPPQLERERKVASAHRDYGAHDQGIHGPVECARATRENLRFLFAPAFERREGTPPALGRGPLDGPHLPQIGLTAMAGWTLDASGAAGRTTLHVGYSR